MGLDTPPSLPHLSEYSGTQQTFFKFAQLLNQSGVEFYKFRNKKKAQGARPRGGGGGGAGGGRPPPPGGVALLIFEASNVFFFQAIILKLARE